jgi:hypothetical protein
LPGANPESRIPNPVLAGSNLESGIRSPGAGPAAQPRLVESYGKLPLSFEINQGQTDSQVKFLSRGSGYSLFLTGNEAVLSLKKSGARSQKSRRPLPVVSRQLQRTPDLFPALVAAPFRAAPPLDDTTDSGQRTRDAVLRMKLVGANPNAKVSGLEELPGKSNYFIGNDPKKWRANVPNYAKVKYKDVYPGVDLVYYGNQGKLEYDFVVQPGADPNQIALDVRAQAADLDPKSALQIDAQGNLVVATGAGEVRFGKPVVYQPATNYERRTKNEEPRNTSKELLDGNYALHGDRVTFEVADYDRRRPVVIDPVLAYSTYLGGRGNEEGLSIAADASGSAYVTGWTGSSDFPTTRSGFDTFGAGMDAFVSKLNASGSALVYSTFLGGQYQDAGYDIAVDSSGNAYVTGGTTSDNFPTTPGAFQTTYGGSGDVFVSKLNMFGSALVYSTYIGSTSNYEDGWGIAVDALGNAYVTGRTASFDFPTTAGSFNTTFGGGDHDAFASKLNAIGSALDYSTYLGGRGDEWGLGIAVDGSGSAYVTGSTSSSNFPTTPAAFQTYYGGGERDAFVSKLNASGSTLFYSTYLGGSNDDYGSGIAVDGSRNAYVTGGTASSDFPVTPGAFKEAGNSGFVTKLNPAGSRLVYSTSSIGGSAIALDAAGNAYLTGGAGPDFPTTSDAFQTTYGGSGDVFVSKLNPGGSALLYSTYLGGSGAEVSGRIAVDSSGDAFVTGYTFSFDFPTTLGDFQPMFGGGEVDVFVAKMSIAAGDTTPPVTTARLSGPKGNNGWYRGTVAVTLSATDPGSPVAATYYSVDGGAQQTYSAPFSITGAGVHQLSFYSVDPAGNQEKAHQLTIKIDATPPTVTVAVQPATLWPPNGAMVKVSVSGTITDATSGVDPSGLSFRVTDEYGSIQPTGSVTLGADGSYNFVVSLQASRRGTDLNGRFYTVTVGAEDNAGNTASTSSTVIVPHDQGR